MVKKPLPLIRVAGPIAERPPSSATKELALDRDRSRSYTARMHRDAKEVLVGLVSLLVFGVALVVWPPLGVHINDAVQIPLDLIASFF
jgi:hypothetical protein